MTNALIGEKSPYLLQHAQNPVAWLPWGERAFAKARAEDKPIFLSVGYSTCHWCHVMAHESFESQEVADLLNSDFVPVKVDREERPDVDRIYMLFVQASTGSGGWPMSVWLTPELRPFFGGTYFAPQSRHGRPGFIDVLKHLSKAWKEDRARIESSSVTVLDQLSSYIGTSSDAAAAPDRALLDSAFYHFRRTFDSRYGGFGSAPKFPRVVAYNFLLRYHALTKNEEALDMTVATLDAMQRGGMHDQLGGGFHRYSVDERWFVPHFEKMLYDQAQLASSYLEAFQITGNPEVSDTARRIFEYVLRDMTDSTGGFFSAEDADSPDPEHPGHNREGAFYVWKAQEISEILEGDSDVAFRLRYGVEPDGNVHNDPHGEFTGQNILYRATPLDEVSARLNTTPAQVGESLKEWSSLLFEAREQRPRPHLDNKILTSWNALMISALVKGFIVLGEPAYLSAARRAASFVSNTMYADQVLLRRYCAGEAAVPAFLDDYAFFIQALLDLFEATSEPDYLLRAAELAGTPLARFEDAAHGGFFSTTERASDLVLRIKDDYDGAEPSGNSVATDVLLRMAHVTGDLSFSERAERSLQSFGPKLQAQPSIAPQMLVAVGRFLAEPAQTIVRCREINAEVESILALHRKTFKPYDVIFALTDDAAAALAGRFPFLGSLERKGRITIYECRNFVCDLPKVLE
ncbi:MAG TPA: thioredoxin domain-containing protein [Bryobacteraceae bacterium]|jgi:hypothetical protein|nr:thioredoxin domain-containing protein [Bryobacteraceae bacterium]